MGILIRQVHLIDDSYENRHDVYIEGSRIASVDAKPEHFTADEVIDGSRKLLMPGLINCHTHAYMSVFRNYADDLPFDEWLFGKIDPLEGKMTAEDAYWGNLLAISEMIRTGTTCFVDMHMFPGMSVKACADTGMRGVITRGLVGSDRNDKAATVRLKQAFDEMEEGLADPAAKVTFGLAPHAIYTCGEDLLRYVAETAHEKGMLLNIHLTESQYEYETCKKEHGRTPVKYLADLGFFEGPVLLPHCVYLEDGDYELLKNPNVTVVTNPASNMKLANGFAPVARMLKEGVRVCLGTDGAASNNSLNMIREMNLLSLCQKGVTRDALALTAEETYRIAVENGYRAVGLQEKLGAVERGKTADLILIDEHAPNLLPCHNAKAALVYSASGYEVTDSIIGGKIVMRDRNLVTIDEERVDYEIQRIIDRF